MGTPHVRKEPSPRRQQERRGWTGTRRISQMQLNVSQSRAQTWSQQYHQRRRSPLLGMTPPRTNTARISKTLHPKLTRHVRKEPTPRRQQERSGWTGTRRISQMQLNVSQRRAQTWSQQHHQRRCSPLLGIRPPRKNTARISKTLHPKLTRHVRKAPSPRRQQERSGWTGTRRI